MNAELNQHIDRLRCMTTAQLQLKYRELFGQASHSNHKGYLFRRVAWRMQALTEGGLSERVCQYAREMAADADLRLCAPGKLVGGQPAVCVATASRPLDPRVPPPGTQLVKRYKKDTLTVTVLEDGYQYGERVYKSLSATAWPTSYQAFCTSIMRSRSSPRISRTMRISLASFLALT